MKKAVIVSMCCAAILSGCGGASVTAEVVQPQEEPVEVELVEPTPSAAPTERPYYTVTLTPENLLDYYDLVYLDPFVITDARGNVTQSFHDLQLQLKPEFEPVNADEFDRNVEIGYEFDVIAYRSYKGHDVENCVLGEDATVDSNRNMSMSMTNYIHALGGSIYSDSFDKNYADAGYDLARITESLTFVSVNGTLDLYN